MKAVEVFVPSDFPTVTYVERAQEELEKRVREALETPKSPISISGPSKTGKTALIKKIVGQDKLIHIFGSEVSAPQDLWDSILNRIDQPSSVTKHEGVTETVTPNMSAGLTIGIPGIGSGSLGGSVSTSTAATNNNSEIYENRGMPAVARAIADSEYIVFIDDFHYIPRETQVVIGQLIKAGSEAGVRFCIASVPHRSDDVVRSNHELRGRTTNIDTQFWSEGDLNKIADQGFRELNINFESSVITRFSRESCTSPQIMQSLCLRACQDFDLNDRKEELQHCAPTEIEIREILRKTAPRSDYTSLFKDMYAGPRTKGTERKEFKFSDDTTGDVYRASLLALSSDPPSMEFNYADLIGRISCVCVEEKPKGSSITESLKRIAASAKKMYPDQRIVEWDPDAASGTFIIIDPYFLFFLRSSDILRSIVSNKSG